MSLGGLQRTLGLHAGGDHHHPAGGQGGLGGEEQEGPSVNFKENEIYIMYSSSVENRRVDRETIEKT